MSSFLHLRKGARDLGDEASKFSSKRVSSASVIWRNLCNRGISIMWRNVAIVGVVAVEVHNVLIESSSVSVKRSTSCMSFP